MTSSLAGRGATLSAYHLFGAAMRLDGSTLRNLELLEVRVESESLRARSNALRAYSRESSKPSSSRSFFQLNV